MSLLARIIASFAALAGQPIYGDDVDNELNQIVNLLNGTSTNRRASIAYGHATEPALKLNQTGAGDLFKAQANGVDALRIGNNGQIISTIATGTAPIIVSSTTKVTNLNADTVNGIQGSALIRNDTAGQALLGNLRIKKLSTGTYDFQVEVENDTVTFYRYKAADDTRTALFSISGLNSSTRQIILSEFFRIQSGYEPIADTDIARKIDLTNRITVLAIPGLIVTPGTTGRACFFIAPAECVITKVKYGYSTGSPSSDLTLTLNGQAFTLATAAVANQVYTYVVNPTITLTENTLATISSGTTGGHTNVFCQLVGYYTGN